MNLSTQHGIYQIRNLFNNKVYVGSASYIGKRLNTHKRDLINSRHKNKHLQSAWDKYGMEAFVFEILELIQNKFDLIEREQYWIDKFKASKNSFGYNINPSASSRVGIPCSMDTKEKLRLCSLGKKHKPETIEFLRNLSIGKKFSEETRKILSELMKGNKRNLGKKLSEETKKKISEAHKGKQLSEEHKKKLSLSHLNKKLSEVHKLSLKEAFKKRTPEQKRAISLLGLKARWEKRGY